MHFLGVSIILILESIRWPSIKSLVLTANNIDDWLQLWASHVGPLDLVGAWTDPCASGPSLASLSVIDHKENKEGIHCDTRMEESESIG